MLLKMVVLQLLWTMASCISPSFKGANHRTTGQLRLQESVVQPPAQSRSASWSDQVAQVFHPKGFLKGCIRIGKTRSRFLSFHWSMNKYQDTIQTQEMLWQIKSFYTMPCHAMPYVNNIHIDLVVQETVLELLMLQSLCSLSLQRC